MHHLTLLSLLAATPTLASWHKHHQHLSVPGNNFGLPRNATCDYVIVGGGTAGLAVAYRLAESGKHDVAFIKAGGFYERDNGNTSVVPAYCPQYGATTIESAKHYPGVDWGSVTEAQEGLAGIKLHCGRGKTLGGSQVSLSGGENDA